MKKAIGLLMQRAFCGRRDRNLVDKVFAFDFDMLDAICKKIFRETIFFDKQNRARRECYCTAVDTITMCAEVITQ